MIKIESHLRVYDAENDTITLSSLDKIHGSHEVRKIEPVTESDLQCIEEQIEAESILEEQEESVFDTNKKLNKERADYKEYLTAI